MKIFVLGALGMAGHTIALYLSNQGHQVMGYARKKSPVCETIIGDAFDTEKIKTIILKNHYDLVVNCIGILNKQVDSNLGAGIFINSYFPHFVANCCTLVNSKFIHISTDCVFSGNAFMYTEKDVPDETSYYGRTKFLGEVVDGDNLTLRTSIVGPELKRDGIGLFNWFMHQRDNEVYGYTHVMWTGVTTLELAKVIVKAYEQNMSGLYYLSNNEIISKYDLLRLFNKYCCDNEVEIIKKPEPISSKALLCTRNDFDCVIPKYDEMVLEMSNWINENNKLYHHYFEAC